MKVLVTGCGRSGTAWLAAVDYEMTRRAQLLAIRYGYQVT